MKDAFKSNCLLCGEQLIYYTETRLLACAVCRHEFHSEASCEQGHFICNSCHSTSANEMIEKICIKSDSRKPVQLAIDLIKAPSISMHGPEHHFLVPAVLLTAFYNQKGDAQQKEKKIKVARQRADNVLGGFCGFYGACGAGVGTGIFISLVTDTTPLSAETWGLSNQMTAESLRCTGALDGPRCCKRDTFMSLKTARKFLKQKMDIMLDIPNTITCNFNEFNKECIEENCPFHAKEIV
ncbi:MAG TPA: DUF5714 domain-containing protein [Anaerolineales bacterium]